MSNTDLATGPGRQRMAVASMLAAAGIAACAIFAWTLLRDRRSTPQRAARAETVRWPKAVRKAPEHGGIVHFDLLAKLLAEDRRGAPADEWLRELHRPNPPFRVPTQGHPLVGHSPPDFTLLDSRGKPWNLRGQLAKGPVVLVFYLGYYCNYCVHDLFELNADLDRFHTLGAEVVAVSGDPPELTRQRFAKFGAFGFAVLSDPGHAVAQSYGMFRPANGSKSEVLLHGTFVIGRDCLVHWAGYGERPFRNDMALLYEIDRLQNPANRPLKSQTSVRPAPATSRLQ